MRREICHLKKLFCLLLILGCFTNARSQNHSEDFASPNAIFIEFSNRGPVFSINYDRIFRTRNNVNLSYRIGLSVNKGDLAIPVGLNLFCGEKNSHLEWSLTLIPYIESYKGIGNKQTDSDGQLFIVPGLGYRYQQKEGGLLVRTVISPVLFLDPPSNDFWNMDPKLLGGISASLGWSF